MTINNNWNLIQTILLYFHQHIRDNQRAQVIPVWIFNIEVNFVSKPMPNEHLQEQKDKMYIYIYNNRSWMYARSTISLYLWVHLTAQATDWLKFFFLFHILIKMWSMCSKNYYNKRGRYCVIVSTNLIQSTLY